MRPCAALLAVGMAAVGCASAPPPPSAGQSTLAGHVELIPPEAARANRGGGYGDRRLRGVERVDYSEPGFAVVYVEAVDDAIPAADRSETELTLASRAARVRFEPADVALRAGDTLFIRNADEEDHLVSVPGRGVIRSLAAGERIALRVDHPGDYGVHLLDRPGTGARVFATPGPFARVASDGRYAIVDLPAGRHRVHLWHARLPPSSRIVDLVPDTVNELDWAVGVRPDESGER